MENFIWNTLGNERQREKKKTNQRERERAAVSKILVTDRLPNRFSEMSRKIDKIEQNITYEFKSHSIMLCIIKFHAVNIHSFSLACPLTSSPIFR